jgi:hypothetical protein
MVRTQKKSQAHIFGSCRSRNSRHSAVATHVLGDGPGRNSKSQSCEFGLNASLTPKPIFGGHPPDGTALSASIGGQGSLPATRLNSRAAMARSARWRLAKKTQSVSPTLSATTVPSVSSSASAPRIKVKPVRPLPNLSFQLHRCQNGVVVDRPGRQLDTAPQSSLSDSSSP